MPAAVPEIEIAHHAHALGPGRENDEGNARHAFQRHRMRAELFVKLNVRPLRQEIEVELREHRREAVGILHVDHIAAEARPQLIALRAVGEASSEQACIVDPVEFTLVALFVNDADFLRIRQKGAHHRDVALHMPPEIMERVGMPALDDGIGFARELAHVGLPSERERMRSVPAIGTRSQSGRCAISYSIS